MKTTFDIADALLDQARRLAARDGETLRSLVAPGLHGIAAEGRWEDASVGTPGASASAYESLAWETKRALIYGEPDPSP